ncbi:MAG: hypothetical protein ABI211_16490 [Vicinamibacterales bacterium]
MRTSLTGFGTWVSLAVVCSLTTVLPAAAQSSRSAEAAKQLAQALDASKLEAIAAADPADPQAFVAALYFQGSQILVVSAKYAAPPLLVAKIKEQNYRDVYIDLSSASVAGSKVFLIDAGVDGLSHKPGDGGADSYEHGTKQVQFDGDWKKAKISEEEYMKTYAEADERYVKMLSLLQAQAKVAKGGS